MTTYAQIYERFAQKITDFKLLELADEDVTDMLHEWMVAALPKCRFIENDLDARNDEQQTFDVNLTNTEIEIICTQMVSEWLAPQINSQLYVSQFFGGKEEKLGIIPQLAIFGNGIVYSFVYAGTPLEL